MIRVKCPKCEKRLGVDDTKAGGVAVCPECGQKFRIPGIPAKTAAAAQKSDPAKSATGKAKPKPQPPARPKEAWEEEDSSPYEVATPAEPEPETKKRRGTGSDAKGVYGDARDEDFGLDKEYVRRRNKLKQKRTKETQWIPGLNNTITLLIALAVLWIGLGIMPVFKKELAYGTIGAGLLISGFGRIWLIVAAFKEEGTGAGLMVIFLPFYDIYFAVTHMDRGLKPLITNYVGSFIMVTGILVGGLRLIKDAIKEIENRTSQSYPALVASRERGGTIDEL
jgi:hypothetical protein